MIKQNNRLDKKSNNTAQKNSERQQKIMKTKRTRVRTHFNKQVKFLPPYSSKEIPSSLEYLNAKNDNLKKFKQKQFEERQIHRLTFLAIVNQF